MGADEFAPSDKPDLLLVGDSVVFGGNAYAGYERLGPSLEARLQERSLAVWPIAAGSWALRNELIWLRDNPEVLAKIEQVMFVLNSADFAEASSWSCELTHPRQRPFSALWYLTNKYVYAFATCGDISPALRVPAGNLAEELGAYLALHGHKTLFVLYPNKQESVDPTLYEQAFAAGRELLANSGTQVLDVAGHPAWQASLYRDDIHPTPEGNQVLAGILGEFMLANDSVAAAQLMENKTQ